MVGQNETHKQAQKSPAAWKRDARVVRRSCSELASNARVACPRRKRVSRLLACIFRSPIPERKETAHNLMQLLKNKQLHFGMF